MGPETGEARARARFFKKGVENAEQWSIYSDIYDTRGHNDIGDDTR